MEHYRPATLHSFQRTLKSSRASSEAESVGCDVMFSSLKIKRPKCEKDIDNARPMCESLFVEGNEPKTHS